MTVAKNLHATFLHLLEMNGIQPHTGFDTALSIAANLGVTMCNYYDDTMETMFRAWLSKARKQNRLMPPPGAMMHRPFVASHSVMAEWRAHSSEEKNADFSLFHVSAVSC